MANYYLVDLYETEKHIRGGRFDTLEMAEAWSRQELKRVEVSGPAEINLIHERSGEVELKKTIRKEARAASVETSDPVAPSALGGRADTTN
jgi:hypothetical protein